MNLHTTATLLGFGREFNDLFWTMRNRKVSEFKPIHDETRSIFVHVPKTAGVSFHRAMYDKSRDYGHAPAVAFRHRDPERFAAYWKFAFMRDPVDRFISAFYYLTTNPHNPRDAAYGQEHFVKYGTVSNLVAEMQKPATRAKVMSWVHFLPQSYYLCDAKGNVLVDDIFRTTEFDAALPVIAERLGVEFTPSRENVSRRTREGELNAEEQAFVERLYHDDRRVFEQSTRSP